MAEERRSGGQSKLLCKGCEGGEGGLEGEAGGGGGGGGAMPSYNWQLATLSHPHQGLIKYASWGLGWMSTENKREPHQRGLWLGGRGVGGGLAPLRSFLPPPQGARHSVYQWQAKPDDEAACTANAVFEEGRGSPRGGQQGNEALSTSVFGNAGMFPGGDRGDRPGASEGVPSVCSPTVPEPCGPACLAPANVTDLQQPSTPPSHTS
ncbi:hypothetical protein EYF80_009543 [Liparis tanakae]|uniref:Uncharacterized protein n=1 Tax=Liparis tanakae TaxID=230148 RepID=A0A4Z2IRI4_9TELE|nr:hypothetical protein EYF80_009543 [Liparis tanakae]